MPHEHICRFCEEDYICEKSADVCFRESIVCEDCSFGNKIWGYIAILIVAVVLVGLPALLLEKFL